MAEPHIAFRHALGEPQKPILTKGGFLLNGVLGMYYVHVLLSDKDGKFYIGYTQDLKKRYQCHLCGDVSATAPRRPIRLIFYEAYLNKYDALRRESYLKTSKGKTTLRAMLKDFLGTMD